MRIKEFLKNLWNELVNDESGQLYGPFSPQTLFGKAWRGEDIRYKPKKLTTPTYTPYTYRGAVTTRKPTAYTPVTATSFGTGYAGTGYQPQITPTTEKQYTPPITTEGARAGGGGAYNIPGFPTYSLPNVRLNVPSFAWSPTGEERAGWGETARTRAGIVIDPQRQAEIEALEKFKGEVTSQMGEINPRMTEMSLALANVVENSMKQEIVDELIRRGATTSGELPRQLGEAGRYEAEQRGGIEEERNRLIAELQKQQLGREELSGERLTELEGMRGMYEAQELFEQEKYAREMSMAEKQATFGAELSKAQMQYGAATSLYEAEYNRRLFEAQMGQQQWERGFSQQQLELQRATAAYGREPDPFEELKRRQYELDIEAKEYDLEQARKAAAQMYGFYGGGAGFKAGQVSGMRRY